MLALLATVLVSSLLGSCHCAGMCGAFVAFAVGGPNPRNRILLQVSYHGGRLVTYSLLGAIAGYVGVRLDLAGSLLGLQRVAASGAGALMIGLGLVAVLRLFGAQIGKFPTPKVLQILTLTGHRAAAPLGPAPRAFAIGLLTTLLPCGWLWVFVIWAFGASGSALGGALFMAAFWLGTVPILAAMGVSIQQLTPRLRAYIPAVTAGLLLAVGTWTLLSRGQATYAMHPVASSTPEKLLEEIRHANPHQAPCCLTRPAGSTQP